jgi:hypothetical protein
LDAGSAPVTVVIEVSVATPVVAIPVIATLAGLGKLVPVVVSLTAVSSVTMDIAVQALFPLLDVPAATVIAIRPGSRRAAR